MNAVRVLVVIAFLMIGAGVARAAAPPPAATAEANTTRNAAAMGDSSASASAAPLPVTTGDKDSPPLPPASKELIGRGRRRKRGAIYARFSTRFQASIKDQLRACREWAAANDIDVDPSMIFIDLAVSGKKSRRAGLDLLRAALNAKSIDVLIVFTTNRLHRNSYKARQFIEEEVLENGTRCVCIRSGVDTADLKKWRLLHGVNAIVDETMLQGTADQVRESHIGMLMAGKVFGTLTFGYTGEVIPDTLTRLKRPQRRLIVDPVTSVWVKTIFVWYAEDGLSIAAIVIKLRDAQAPAPYLCKNGWTALAVRRLLSNQRYTGVWSYGSTKTVWLSKKDYGRQVPQTPLKTLCFPSLRIVDDVLFARAQERLAARNTASGRKPRQGTAKPRILNGLLFCPTHQRAMYYSHGFYCPDCRLSSTPALFSELSADLAVTLICQRLAADIQADGELAANIVSLFSGYAQDLGRPDLQELPGLQRRDEQIGKSIAAILRNLGGSEADDAESEALLAERRAERASVRRRIAELQRLAEKPVTVPTLEEAKQMVARVAEVLQTAATGGDPADAHLLRQIIIDLTGGKIECSQQGEAKAKRGWLRGHFHLQLLAPFAKELGQGSTTPMPVEIDFRESPALEERSIEVKAMVDQGLMMAEIAIKLGLHRSQVTAALKHWYASRNLTPPDGRARRATLTKKHLTPPMYQVIAPQVMEKVNAGKLLYTIAKELNVDPNTVTQAIAWWHTSQGFPVPDGRGRRKTLDHKSKPYAPRRRRNDNGGPSAGDQRHDEQPPANDLAT